MPGYLRLRPQLILEQPRKKIQGLFVNSRRLALSRTGYVQDMNRIFVKPFANFCHYLRGMLVGYSFEIHDKHRFFVPLGHLFGEEGAAAWFAAAENESGVGRKHVFFRALGIAARTGLAQQVSAVNGAVFGQPAARTPAAVGNFLANRGIQSRAIDARLSAGNDFDKAAHDYSTPVCSPAFRRNMGNLSTL